MAMAGCPHSWARVTISFTSDTPSISLIFVWQCNSTRLRLLVSIRLLVKSGIFTIPITEPMANSLSYLSRATIPLIFTKAPFFTSPWMVASCSFRTNILARMVSVKSVMLNIKILFWFRISRTSRSMIFPRNAISPISVTTCSKEMHSSSKSKP